MNPVDEAPRPTADHFRPWVGRAVSVHGADTPLTLDEVAAFPGPHESFILIFSAMADGGPVIAEGLHGCRFGDGPALDIHIMPIDAGGGVRQLYQAVFN